MPIICCFLDTTIYGSKISVFVAKRDLAIGVASVCPSVCLSHAGIDSKLMNVGLCSFHRLVTQSDWYCLHCRALWTESGDRPGFSCGRNCAYTRPAYYQFCCTVRKRGHFCKKIYGSLRLFHMQYQCTILGFWCQDFVRNTEVLPVTNLPCRISGPTSSSRGGSHYFTMS